MCVVESGGSRNGTDQLATEEPLEIRLRAADHLPDLLDRNAGDPLAEDEVRDRAVGSSHWW
jgi:hypothetical protein